MFKINLHQKNYQYDYFTVIGNILPIAVKARIHTGKP